MLRFLLAAMIGSIVAATPLAAQTFKGPKVDRSFTPVSVPYRRGSNISVFYVKFVEYQGKVAVCGAHVGVGFADRKDSRLYLRGSQISNGDTVMMRDLNYMTNVAEISPQWQADFAAKQDRERLEQAALPKADYRYVTGVTSVCRAAKRTDWATQGAGRTPVGRIKTTRTVRRRR